MNNLDKIIFAIFILVTLAFLWFVSPMGQLYLPIDKEQLQEELNFTLPDKYEIKGIDNFKTWKVYHLRVDEEFPHIISLVVQPKVQLNIYDASNLSQSNEPIMKFWQSTTFVDIINNSCMKENINDKEIDLCSFQARWPIINNDNMKEGHYSLFDKDDKTVFVFSSAIKGTYNKDHIEDLIENVVK